MCRVLRIGENEDVKNKAKRAGGEEKLVKGTPEVKNRFLTIFLF